MAVTAAHEQVGALQHGIVRHEVGGVLVIDVLVHGHAADHGALVDEAEGAFALDPDVLAEVGAGANRQQAEVLATDIDAGVADAGGVGRLAHERQVLSESRRRQGADRRDGGESNERLHCSCSLYGHPAGRRGRLPSRRVALVEVAGQPQRIVEWQLRFFRHNKGF